MTLILTYIISKWSSEENYEMAIRNCSCTYLYFLMLLNLFLKQILISWMNW